MDRTWITKLTEHIQELEFIYGWLNIESNRKQLMKDRAEDDIMYVFYNAAIDLYLEFLTDEEKIKRGMKIDG